MTLVVRHPPGYETERRYAYSVVLEEFLGLDVTYVVEAREDVEIDGGIRVPDAMFGAPTSDWLTQRSLPTADALMTDVFGLAFFMLTRYEEAVRPERDEHGRFPASAAMFSPASPVVNESVLELRTRLETAFPRLNFRRPSFEVIPSHDVDIPTCRARGARRLKLAAGDLLRRRDARLATRRLAGCDVCDTFDFLLDASEQRGLRSAFYFIAERTDGSRDGDYSLDDAVVKSLVRRVHNRGHEVGLHPSYGTFRDAGQVRREFERLRAACAELEIEQSSWGGRQHYLRWENPTTWRAWDDAGLAYDSTVTYAESPGFRAGVCYEYPVFDLGAGRVLALRERPLVAMEVSFLQYLALDHDAAYDAMLELKRICRRYGGQFTLLWHNNRLQTARDRRLYEAVLDG